MVFNWGLPRIDAAQKKCLHEMPKRYIFHSCLRILHEG